MSKLIIVSFLGFSVDQIVSMFSRKIDQSRFEVINASGASEDEASLVVRDATVILKGPGDPYISRKILEAAQDLKLVQFGSVGYAPIDLEAATELNVPVANNPYWNSVSVAEHAIMSMLVLLRKAFLAHHANTQGQWRPPEMRPIRELKGKTVGILGLGSIGTEVAKRLRAFECKILYHKRNRLLDVEEKALGVEFRDFRELLSESDIITVHVPLTDETRGMIGRDEINGMKDGAILINTARSDIIDEVSLAKAVKEGKLSGVSIDVPRNPDKIPEFQNRFGVLKNVIITPHAATSNEAMIRAQDQLVDNICRLLEGEKPLYLVNDVWDF
jgi:phosphoglycerate dehydrogenase-like enzyme